MDDHDLKTLEFDKLLIRLAAHATSAPGRELCLKLKPSSNRRRIKAWQENTTDAKKRLELNGRVSFAGARDLKDILTRLKVYASLSAEELLRVSALLSAAGTARRYGLDGGGESGDSLSEIFGMLEPLTGINRDITRAVIDENTIADDASPALKDIRRKIKKAGDDIHSTMNARLNASREFLSDAVITQRDGRWCLPVKAEFKSRVPGVVHGASSTGLTLFIEPMAAINLNNLIADLSGEEARETERILGELSAELFPHTDTLSDNIKLLARLDMIFAKAYLSEELDAVEPEFTKDRSIDLRGARHPLIDRESVVPVDIRLGSGFTTLVVTGPNTGGKTVSLKTCGLITLMALAGLHIPALPGSGTGIYREVFADIGDEQSIEQSLSTFSSHMTRIVRILNLADESSLCLFDELCGGTDPTEGAALGIAILDRLLKKHVNTMATTHYAEIKVYAMETDGVENASCEFDVDSLKPTYRLLIGIPGRSNAFAISERLGLDKNIIGDARTRLTAENENLEELIAKLNEERSAAERMKNDAGKLKEEARILRDRAREKEDRLNKNREKILSEARAEAGRILKDAKLTADRAVSNINKAGSRGELKQVEQERTRIRDALTKSQEGAKLSGKGPARRVSPKNIRVGDEVSVMPMGGVTGIVMSLPDKDKNLLIRIGALQSRVNVSDLGYPEETGRDTSGKDKSRPAAAAAPARDFAPKALSISPELNLIGMTTDEALPELEKYLDDAYLAGVGEVRIIHGRGTGALKSAVHAKLKKTKYVSSYRLGVHGEGDTGVTVVTLA